MDLSSFATPQHPLRCSSLPLLALCNWRASLLFMNEFIDSAGQAADTGSAVHKAIASWHKNGQDYAGAVEAMKAAIGEYPIADLGDAELHFRPYTKDPRNINAEIILVEEKVQFSLEPAKDDPTQAPIWITGTLDQVRVRNGEYFIDDVKTGKKNQGWEMMHHYTLQIAAYAIGATQKLKLPVQPGAIIRTYGYRVRGCPKPETSPGGVFFDYPFNLEGALLLLDVVRSRVRDIRLNKPQPVPGDYCGYCPANGIDNCLPRLQQLGGV